MPGLHLPFPLARVIFVIKEEDLVTCLPYIQRVELGLEDGFLLLACDGLWDKISYLDAVAAVAKMRAQGLSAVEICQVCYTNNKDW